LIVPRDFRTLSPHIAAHLVAQDHQPVRIERTETGPAFYFSQTPQLNVAIDAYFYAKRQVRQLAKKAGAAFIEREAGDAK
jgi:hypothetical protein